jgi:chaperonin GroES
MLDAATVAASGPDSTSLLGPTTLARLFDCAHTAPVIRRDNGLALSRVGLVSGPNQASHHSGVDTMNIRPLHDRIIIQRLDEGEQRVGGIIIPDTAKEKPQQGKVIAAGTGKIRDDGTRQSPDVKAGDRILFGKYSGQEVRVDGEDYLIMREEDVLGVIAGGDTTQRN